MAGIQLPFDIPDDVWTGPVERDYTALIGQDSRVLGWWLADPAYATLVDGKVSSIASRGATAAPMVPLDSARRATLTANRFGSRHAMIFDNGAPVLLPANERRVYPIPVAIPTSGDFAIALFLRSGAILTSTRDILTNNSGETYRLRITQNTGGDTIYATLSGAAGTATVSMNLATDVASPVILDWQADTGTLSLGNGATWASTTVTGLVNTVSNVVIGAIPPGYSGPWTGELGEVLVATASLRKTAQNDLRLIQQEFYLGRYGWEP